MLKFFFFVWEHSSFLFTRYILGCQQKLTTSLWSAARTCTDTSQTQRQFCPSVPRCVVNSSSMKDRVNPVSHTVSVLTLLALLKSPVAATCNKPLDSLDIKMAFVDDSRFWHLKFPIICTKKSVLFFCWTVSVCHKLVPLTTDSLEVLPSNSRDRTWFCLCDRLLSTSWRIESSELRGLHLSKDTLCRRQ